MTLKNEDELARYLGTALKSYANTVQNGQVGPYRKFLNGETSVTVTITLAEPGGIIVEGEKEEVVEETVEEPAPEEAQVESLAPSFEPPSEVAEPTETKAKPRRRRKTS